MAGNDRILWLNKEHVEEVLLHKDLEEITIIYQSDHRKQIWTSRRMKYTCQ